MALCPEICLLTASAARFSLSGVGAHGDDDGESVMLRLGSSFGLYRRIVRSYELLILE